MSWSERKNKLEWVLWKQRVERNIFYMQRGREGCSIDVTSVLWLWLRNITVKLCHYSALYCQLYSYFAHYAINLKSLIDYCPTNIMIKRLHCHTKHREKVGELQSCEHNRDSVKVNFQIWYKKMLVCSVSYSDGWSIITLTVSTYAACICKVQCAITFISFTEYVKCVSGFVTC